MRHAVVLEGRVARLRPFEPADLESYRAWVNDPGIMELADRAAFVSPEEHRAWYARLLEAPDVMVFAVDDRQSGAYVGNVWLFAIDPRHRKAEVRIILGVSHGRGLGSEAIGLITTHGLESLGLEKLYAYVLATNPRARRAFERAGYVLEAQLKADRRGPHGRVDVWFLSRWAES